MTAQESAERIYGFLTAALSENAVQRQTAERALRQAEEEQDFFASLVMIARADENEIHPQIRWLATVCGKNAVDRSWRRRTRRNAVTDEEREFVRTELMSALGEKHSTIATQLSVWIARIARSDFPQDWPSLITDLCKAVRSQDQGTVLHGVVTLDMVLKVVASKRFERKHFHRVSHLVFNRLYELFKAHLEVLVLSQAPPGDLQRSFRILERCMKGFRRLIAYGCEQLDPFNEWEDVFAGLIQFPGVFLCGARGGNEFQERLSLLAAKLVRVTQQRHPRKFYKFLGAFLDRFFNDIVEFDPEKSSARTCLHEAIFLHNCLKCPMYEISTATIEKFKQDKAAGVSPPESGSYLACRYVVLSCFQEDRVTGLVRAMISKIFIWNRTEVETWANDPEALIMEEELAEWGIATLRRECEALFKTLLVRDKLRLVSVVEQLATSVPQDQPLLLDACYRAVGQAGYDVEGAFNFDSWLNGQLGPILEASYSNEFGKRVIQARAAWLVGQFASQMSRESRQKVYPLLVNLIGANKEDAVIAFTAAKAFQILVEDLGYHDQDFRQYVESCITAFFRLALSAETFEAKGRVLSGVQSVLTRCHSTSITPLADLFATAVPEIWNQSQQQASASVVLGADTMERGIDGGIGGQNRVRQNLVILLKTVVSKIGPSSFESTKMREVIFLLIDFAVDNAKGGNFMLEDGCDLWHTVVIASKDYCQELVHLFARVPAILGSELGYFKEMTDLMKAYILLGEQEFMQQYAGGVIAPVEQSLRTLSERGYIAACDVLDTLLQVFGPQGVPLTSSVLKICLRKVVSRKEGKVVTSLFCALLARASLLNIGDFEKLVLEEKEDFVVDLIETCILTLGALSIVRRRLVVMALQGMTTRYLSSDDVLKLASTVVYVTAGVVNEDENHRKGWKNRSDAEAEFNVMLSTFGEQGGAGDEFGVTGKPANRDFRLPGRVRARNLQKKDMALTVDVKAGCCELISKLRASGEARYQEVMKATDERALEYLRQFIQI